MKEIFIHTLRDSFYGLILLTLLFFLIILIIIVLNSVFELANFSITINPLNYKSHQSIETLENSALGIIFFPLLILLYPSLHLYILMIAFAIMNKIYHCQIPIAVKTKAIAICAIAIVFLPLPHLLDMYILITNY